MTEQKTPYETKTKDWQAVSNRLVEMLQNGKPGPELLGYIRDEIDNEFVDDGLMLRFTCEVDTSQKRKSYEDLTKYERIDVLDQLSAWIESERKNHDNPNPEP